MGRVALIGQGDDSRIVPGFVPAGWEVAYVEDPWSDWTVDDFTLLCFVPGDFRSRDGDDLREGIIRRAEEVGIPVVVMADPRRPETILNLRGIRGAEVFIQRVDRYPRTVARVLREIALRPVVGYVREQIRSARRLPVPLRVGLRSLVGQVPPPVPDAVEALGDGQPVFGRRVNDLIPLAGCSRTYLYDMAQEAGVSLARAARRNVVLHGMLLLESKEGAPDVATRLGYESAWGWRMAVRRDLNETVVEAVQRPLGNFADRLLTTIGVRAP